MNPETLVKWLLLNLLALILTSPSSNSRIEIITRQNDLANILTAINQCRPD
jgi:hypothetical protein